MNYCSSCIGKIILNAFSKGICGICHEEVICPHIPCYMVCYKCSEKLGLCIQCGSKINDKKV